jgi:peptidoglycan/LPS O-acetylase OafA/YrhL
MKQTFRNDIEALRGISVIFVILYHFKFENLNYKIINGGFLGVDIFFVISGFIITKIIIDRKIDNFSLLSFYRRRIKRIIPLLSVVLFVSLIFLPFIFDTFLVNKNIDSLIFSASGFSNFYFWITSTIYDFAEKNNIINLHFWSLSIEIQFYILFPILFILFKNNQKILIFCLILLFISSYLFVVNIYIKHNFFNFYNSFSRVFEFLFGAIVFFHLESIKSTIKKKFHNFLYSIGFILLFFCVYKLNNQELHPNPFLIFFLISLALIIIFNNDCDYHFIKKYLSYIGKISYSLYLWHFLILVIGNNYFEKLTDYKKFFLLILCFTISILTYFFIEKKFRKIKLKYSLYLFCFLVFFLIIFKTLYNIEKKNKIFNLDNYFLADDSSYYLKNQNKLSIRKIKNIYSFENDSKNYSPQFSIHNNKIKILIVGDSHSKDLFNIFKTNEDKFTDLEFARYGINLVDLNNNRKDIFVNSYNFINSDYIFFSQRYKENDLDYINDLIYLAKKYKKKLVLFLKRPEFEDNDMKNRTVLDKFYLANNKILNKEVMDKFMFKKLKLNRFEIINDKIKQMFDNRLIYYDLYPIFCNKIEKKCHSITKSGNKIFYDYGHLTLNGSKFIGNLLSNKNFLNEIVKY